MKYDSFKIWVAERNAKTVTEHVILASGLFFKQVKNEKIVFHSTNNVGAYGKYISGIRFNNVGRLIGIDI
jgi:hypothetical protein